MKPFDLEAAKAGAKVVTREGREYRLLYSDLRGATKHRLVGLVDMGNYDHLFVHTPSGTYHETVFESVNDLFMAPEERTGWVNVYSSDSPLLIAPSIGVFSTKEEADARAASGRTACVKITWEV